MPVSDGKATTICPSHLGVVEDSGMEAKDSVGVLDGLVDRLDNFKNLDKVYLFKEVISAERIKMGDSDSQQRSNNPCILETGFSMGLSPCPSGRKVGGRNKGKFKDVKEVKDWSVDLSIGLANEFNFLEPTCGSLWPKKEE
nr:hypothetical protein CFP56_37850 [Quercus suber]